MSQVTTQSSVRWNDILIAFSKRGCGISIKRVFQLIKCMSSSTLPTKYILPRTSRRLNTSYILRWRNLHFLECYYTVFQKIQGHSSNLLQDSLWIFLSRGCFNSLNPWDQASHQSDIYFLTSVKDRARLTSATDLWIRNLKRVTLEN